MEHHATFPWILALNLLALVVAVVLWKGKEISGIFRNRHDELKTKMDEAERYHQEASAVLTLCEQKLKSLDQHIATIMESSRVAAEKEKKVILERAEVSAQRIVSDAQVLAAQQLERMKRSIQAELSAAAIEEARRHLLANASRSQHESFVNAFFTRGPTHASGR